MKLKGFTLIELMVVIAIIGILASIVMVSLSSAQAKGRDAKRVGDIRTLQLALETYYNDHSYYPTSLSQLAPNYLPTLPTDPSFSGANTCTTGNQSGCYFYNAFNSSGGSGNCSGSSAATTVVKYHLGAAMESNTTSNAGLFSQSVQWNDVSPYVLCTVPSGGGQSGSGAAFYGISSGCSVTTSSTPSSCYDVTN